MITLSPRISAQAITNLLSETHCEAVVCADSSQVLQKLDQVKKQMAVQATPMLRRIWFDRPAADDAHLHRDVDKAKEAERMVIIMHSSGSTGLPKPIYTNHKRYTQPYQAAQGTKDFMTLPLSVLCDMTFNGSVSLILKTDITHSQCPYCHGKCTNEELCIFSTQIYLSPETMFPKL